MNSPKIRTLGINQDGFTMCWKARGDVEGIGWLEAWGDTFLEALEALRRHAAERVAERPALEEDRTP
jgi:hypothetical protein